METDIEMPFHGFKPHKVVLQKEDTLDREIFLLKAQGFTNKRIASQLGVTEVKVGYTVRQPWFMRNMAKFLHAKGEPAVERLLEIVSKDAINIANDAMLDEGISKSQRAKIAVEMIKLSRGTKLVVENATPDLKRLQEEEAALREQLEVLRGSRDTSSRN